ncbi:MAG: hypothetical protein KC462_00145 [Cyanobacteria bacterium HKST-UBA05]|nr:hypothetical protein [Cyanobacteria bacterium HKST-UBA05]
MHITAALTYPFRSDNIKPALMWPIIIHASVVVVAIAVVLVAVIFGAVADLSEDAALVVLIPLFIGLAVVGLIVSAPMIGYLWALTGVCLAQGYQATSPPFKGNWVQFTWAGGHLYLLSLILAIPSVLNILTLGLLTPFFMGPFLLSAQQCTVAEYFRQLGPGISLSKDNYLRLLGATYMGIPLMLGYWILALGLNITIIGYLFSGACQIWCYMAWLSLFVQQVTPKTEAVLAQADPF